MDLALFRKGRGLTVEAAAEELGLKSKGYLSAIENGRTPPLELALKIQVWSGGAVPAAQLRPDCATLIAAAFPPNANESAK